MKQTTGFFESPSDENMGLYQKKIDEGYKEMYFTAPYNWSVVNVLDMKIFSYCEGDTTLLEFEDRTEFLDSMQKHNAWITDPQKSGEIARHYNEMEARMQEVQICSS